VEAGKVGVLHSTSDEPTCEAMWSIPCGGGFTRTFMFFRSVLMMMMMMMLLQLQQCCLSPDTPQ